MEHENLGAWRYAVRLAPVLSFQAFRKGVFCFIMNSMSLTFALFKTHPELIYGFSERADGPMKVKDPAVEYRERRKEYFSRYDIDLNQVVTGYCVHGSRVTVVGTSQVDQLIPESDGLVTQQQRLFLSMTGADCFPIYLFDPVTKTVGLAHAGWRGIVGGILPNLIQAMSKEFQAYASNILMGIGPGIRACHFQIQEDILSQFDPAFVEQREEKLFVDLPRLLIHQAIQQGISGEHIEDAKACTYCLFDRYFSYRRDQPKIPDPMLAFIGLRQA